MTDLPYTRALHTDDYLHPALQPYAVALDDFETYLSKVGVFGRKDHRHRSWEYANCLRQMRELFPDGRRLSIHDTGSGGSYFPLYLKRELEHEVSVSDSMGYGSIEATLIEQCQKLHLEIPMYACPAEALTLPSASFDVTCCISVIEHVAADQYLNALRELCRVTKPGGYVFITSDYFRDLRQADLSPFRKIQHTCLMAELVEQIPAQTGAEFCGGVDLTYRGDFVHNYSFVNICLKVPDAQTLV